MKSFANWVMKGRMQAVIAALLFAAFGLVLTPLMLFSSAVIILTVLRQGWLEGTLVIVASLAVFGLGALMSAMPAGMLLVGLMVWLPAALLGGVLGMTGSLRITIEVAALLAAGIVVLQYGLVGDPAAFWAAGLNDVLQRIDPEALSASSAAQLQQSVELVAGWMAGGVAAVWLLGSIASLVLARHWSALIDQPGAFGAEFRRLRFGRWALLIVPLLLIVGVLASGGEPTLIGQLYLVGMLLFMVQGISLVHGLVTDFGASRAWLIGMYLLLFLLAPQAVPLLAVAGYVDGWLDFRGRAQRRRSNGADDN